MHELFTIHIWMAITGGAVGGISAFYDQDKDHKKRIGEILTDFAVSVIFGVSLTTYAFDPTENHPFVYMGLAMAFGGSARVVMRIFKIGFPAFIKAKLEGWLNNAAMGFLESQARKRNEEVIKKMEDDNAHEE